MIGVVLCGGQSTRMGSDKALLQLGNKTWVDIAVVKLLQLQMPVCVSVNSRQFDIVNQQLLHVDILQDNVCFKIGGPLLGLLSVHYVYPTKDILLLACDMPNITFEILQYLKVTHSNTGKDATVFINNEQLEPLCAIYSATALRLIMAKYLQQGLVKHSMHYILQQLQVTTIEVPTHWQANFINCNTVSDLANL